MFCDNGQPVSFDLRRDVGIWTGILAIVHTAIGLIVDLTNSRNCPRRRRESVLGSGAYLDVPGKERQSATVSLRGFRIFILT
jgi:hypothetical protein